MLGSNIMSVNYFNNYLFLTQMHSFWMFLSVATLCTLIATAEAKDYLMDGILKYLESRNPTPKQQQQAMTTTQRPVLKNVNSKMQNDNRIEEEEEPTDIQTNANTAEICILLSPIILIALVLKKI